MGSSSDNSNLLKNCLSGKKQAWDIFVQRYSKLVYHSINKAIKVYHVHLQQEDIEDIYSAVFLSLLENDYRKLRQFEGKKGCSLPSWIRLISVRLTIDFLRSHKNHISIEDQGNGGFPLSNIIEDKGVPVDISIGLSEAAKIIRKSIGSLPPSDRLFMELYYRRELSVTQIASIMNVSVNTVYSKKKRTREKLKLMLQKQGLIAR